MNRVRVIVSGRVQGVSFRDACRRKAIEHRVSGWVRNRADGGVEAVFEGAPGAVQAMVAWSRLGPPAATVEQIELHQEAPSGLDGFTIEI
ncbi:acylphosphatase [Actinospica durhamensis]|uniref:Acylphosphatase n=1 Tax=Actinospica durhamensis TaxID=1508375 RepID=A0A941ESQ5_9ACTN|nr:acylphosphatase [Actinospica durhamensis]MBR7835777.1 acylphosphatase [Actinospica durhamensis]